MKKLRTLLIGLTLVGSLAVASSTAANASRPKNITIVLVHGAFADSSSWNGEVERLLRRGYKVVAVANPLRGVAGDSAYLKSIVDSIDGDVLLACHSYGCMVTSGVHDPKVKGLVFVAGFAPERGESAGELSAKFPGSTLGQTLVKVPLPNGTTDLYVRQDLYPQQFAADVPETPARIAAATQRPIAENALSDPSGDPAWHDVPSWFLIPTRDRNIPLAAQRFMANRAHGHVTEAPGASHAVLVSQPGRTTDVILQAAESVE
jgi:pimeloyl-ACP methyl ester carboxylesterase